MGKRQPYRLTENLTMPGADAVARHGASWTGTYKNKKGSLLAIVQLPPPVHGVSVMNEAVVTSAVVRRAFDLDILPLRFATSMSDLGRFRLGKLFRTLVVAVRLVFRCLRRRPDLAYQTLVPLGVGFYRDLLLVGVLKLFGVPLIFHLHGRGVRSAARSVVSRAIYRWVFAGSLVVQLSPRLYEDVAEFVPPERCFFVPNGIPDPARAHAPTRSRPAGEPVHLLFMSNLRFLKGPIVLLHALIALRRRGLSFRASLVGPWAESQCARECESLVRDHGLDSVVYPGAKFGREKEALMASTDIFVLPTYHPSESLPIVILEAMSFGLPVVSTLEGGIPDMVEDGVTGFLVPPRDEIALAERLERLIRDGSLRAEMGRCGRQRYLENFTLEAFEARICEVLEGAFTTKALLRENRERAGIGHL